MSERRRLSGWVNADEEERRMQECRRIADANPATTKAGAAARCWLFLAGPSATLKSRVAVLREAGRILAEGGFNDEEIQAFLND